jgi:hypothetical protein
VLLLLGSTIAAALLAANTGAVGTAAPTSTAPPTVSGKLEQGRVVTTDNGQWGGSPTSFTYIWQQCDASGANCTAIAGATSKSYTPTASDVDHSLRVQVTATNADGSATATSTATAVVSSSSPPVSTAAPTISGTAKIGEELSAQPGNWTGGVQSFAYQWQLCYANRASCTAVTDATARVYGVRSADAGQTLRVVVSATNLAGSTNAVSAATATVATLTAPPPVATPAPRSHLRPTIAFLSLHRIGFRIYARFRVCAQSTRPVIVIETDLMAGRLSYSRTFAVPAACGTNARSWTLVARFRHPGLFISTLRAVDHSGASSPRVHRSVGFPSGL